MIIYQLLFVLPVSVSLLLLGFGYGLAQATIAAVLQAAVDEAVGRGLGGEGSRIGLDDIERGRATLQV